MGVAADQLMATLHAHRSRGRVLMAICVVQTVMYVHVLAGYYGDGLNAIILFSGCYLPDRHRKDYNYVMDNLF